MELKNLNIVIDKIALNPTLKVEAELNFPSTIEVPISISGRLLTDDGKVISLLNEYTINTEEKCFELYLQPKVEKEKIIKEKDTKQYYAILSTELSSKAIDHIELRREMHSEKSVYLALDFIIKYLKLPGDNIFSSNKNFLEIYIKRQYRNFDIKQSEWIKKYAPYLGIGNFLLLELEIPNKQKVASDWIDIYERLYLRLNEMHDAIKQGDWKQTMNTARQFYENLKFDTKKFPKHLAFKENLRNLFLDDQHSPEGFDDFYTGIFNFFNYISKFIHDKSNKTGSINRIPIATKEDAYFVYALALGLLNIIGKKTSKV